MKEWFTAAEIAAFALPGVPSGKRNVTLKARREHWPSRERKGRGGGREYHISSLPESARLALAARIAAAPAKTVPPAPPREVRSAGVEHHDAADARIEILRECNRLADSLGLSRRAGRLPFCNLYNAGKTAVSAAARAAHPHISPSTLANWGRRLAREGIAGLADKRGRHRKGAGIIDRDPEIRDLIVGLIASKPHCNAKHAMQALRARFDGRPLPSFRTVQRWMASWRCSNREILTALTNPDQWRGKFMTAMGSASEQVVRLNQLWEMDSTPADVMLADGRHAVVAVVDVFSRRAKLIVSRTSKSVAIAALLRRAILDWGVPETVKTDNGQDYTSNHIRRALADLGADHDTCPPFSPHKKPHVERFIGTFARGLAELLPGYIGHSVAERAGIEARRSFADRLLRRGEAAEIPMTREEFQKACDRWCADVYGHETHDGLGQSPFAAASAWRGPLRRVEDARALDILLAAAPGDGFRTVGKKGIACEGLTFIAPELGAWVGKRVRVLYDDADAGRIYVFGAGGEGFICAAEAPEITGISRADVAAAAKAHQKTRRAQVRALRDLSESQGLGGIAGEILAAAAERSEKIVAFPLAAESHSTPALEQASAAAAASQTVPATALTAQQQEAAAREWARLEAPPAEEAVGPDGRPYLADDRTFALWLLANPDKCDATDKAWLEERMRSRTFRTWVGIEEEKTGTA